MPKAKYNTKQKQIILDCLTANNHKMMTCDEISDCLKDSGTPVGKATLYRYLDSLVVSGDARKLNDDSKKCAAYQLIDKNMDCHSHMHLKCITCGALIHLGCEFMSGVGEHIFEHHNFKIDNSRTMIYGTCSECCKKGGK